jgi:hypothetical protein
MQPEVRKRRSTRIVQAVPLVVSGVDALGRPFQEHTSTLIINCHGARYQSKHYVLKNMWVTLEVPHTESGRPPRSVRGKVTWIQRPRSVRQLFQIALELEYPGNVWGIAFPPEDWFPFVDNQMPQPVDESGLPMAIDAATQPEEGFSVDNVHFMPVSEAADALQAVKQQVARLIADAQQQIQSAAREAVAEAIGAEARSLHDHLQSQAEEAAHAVQTAAAQAIERAAEQSATTLSEQQAALGRSLREDFTKTIAPETAKAVQLAQQEIAQGGETNLVLFEQRLQSALQGAQEAARQLGLEGSAGVERLQARVNQWNEGFALRAEEFAARMDNLSRETVDRTQAHLDAMTSAEGEKFAGAAEAALSDFDKRIEPILEAAGQESVMRLALQLEERLLPHRKRAEGLIERLSAAQELPEETLRAVQNRVQQLAEQEMREAAGRLRASLGAVESEFQASAASTRAAWLAEFEQRADEIRNLAADSLGKTAEWYEKKTQVQMETTFEKGIEQAAVSLREKAGEVSGVFAAELDHYSRSYVDHAQNQLDEVMKESFEHARNLFREAADTTAAAFNDEIQKSAQGDLDGLHRALETAREDARTLTETAAEQVRAKLRLETDSCLGDFQNRMATAVEQGVSDAGQQLETQLAPVMDAWRTAAEAHQKQFAETLSRLSGELVESYKSRLENVSNAWTLATVTSLDQHSQKLIFNVAQSAEDRLREACSNAFAGIGESLRARLVEMAGGLSAFPAPPEEK